MKNDTMMEKGYTAVRDKSRDRNASSEDEMDFNHSQALAAAGKDNSFLVDNIPLVNPTKNKNFSIQPSDGSKHG
jgi:hypothetical protein